MAVLDSTQFNQLVQEVREALLAGSQGVGEVEIVSSLSNIVSLPALRLVGATESVVEAPLELLSAPAVEAAADARKATDDAVVAAVNAEAAADLSEAERKDLAEIKEQAIKAGTDAAAKGDKAFSGAMNAENATLYAMQVASYLQTKLEQAQIVILSGKAMQDVIGTLDSQVKDSILICASTREAAYAAILQLRELQKQVAQAIVDAYAVFDQMQLSDADARQATQVAVKAMERICELSERTEQVIIESVIQTGEARLVTLRLETLEKDLLLSKSAADTATRLAHEQADRAKQSADESERLNMDSIMNGWMRLLRFWNRLLRMRKFPLPVPTTPPVTRPNRLKLQGWLPNAQIPFPTIPRKSLMESGGNMTKALKVMSVPACRLKEIPEAVSGFSAIMIRLKG